MDAQKIPVNSLLRHIQPLQEQLSEAADEVIRSGYFIKGPSVRQFETEFSTYCGVAHCIGVANGTDALELSLKAIGVGPGDRVVVAANAAMYGTSAVLAAGAEPLFVDVDPATATIAPDDFARALASTVGVKAIIATHLYGQLAAIEELVRIAHAHNVQVVEDCAQAHGARLPDGRRSGSMGDIASFSFYPTKNLGALGDGGAVVTNDSRLADRVRKLGQYGWTQKYNNGLQNGRNSRLDEIQARMLSVMLPYLDGWNTRRRAIADRYTSQINHPDIATPAAGGEDYVAHLYVIKSNRREDLRQHLTRCFVETEIHYPRPDHRQICFNGRWDDVLLPVTERESETVLTLPCFPELSDAEVQQVIDACNRF